MGTPQANENAILLGKVAQGVETLTAGMERLERRMEDLAKEGKHERDEMKKRLSSLETERTRQRTTLRVLKVIGGLLTAGGGWHLTKHWP